jgi:hypothetical protein
MIVYDSLHVYLMTGVLFDVIRSFDLRFSIDY